jgi:tRNA uridine 5-carboxymethylaminomethyl modification enzyme
VDSDRLDIVVIGAGHAGCEAARAAARLGMKVLIACVRLDRIGWMPCNPSIGGPAKGHLTREIDALGGMQALVTDASTIHVRWLNTKKGPAVRALRAQCDKSIFARECRKMIESEPNITIREGIISEIAVRDNLVEGVIFGDGFTVQARAVVLATGTFLGGMIFRGEERIPAGREGESGASELSQCLHRIGLPLGRLKTGTVPRVRKDTIDFSSLEMQSHDPSDPHFSFLKRPPNGLPRLPCYITHTTDKTREIINANLRRAALFSGDITGPGPRYCPSIEDKYRKFPDKIQHPVFLEPEAASGPLSDEIYLQGLSTSLPADVQDAYVRSIPGLENAVIARYGYAIEYDYIDPLAVTVWGSSKQIPNLFFGGQIMGTTGYEEAAGLGLLAGINAARHLRGSGRNPLVLGRDQAYLGVMTDDLATRGVQDPYRMLTGRAEWRLLLRFDDADRRLTPIGREIGLVDDERWGTYLEREKEIARLTDFLSTERVRVRSDRIPGLIGRNEPASTRMLSDWLKVPGISLEELQGEGLIEGSFSADTIMTVEASIKYEGYLKRQESDVRRLSRAEHVRIPDDFPFENVEAISRESREKLGKVRPRTLGQAARISGVKPSDIAVLDILLAKRAGRTGAD